MHLIGHHHHCVATKRSRPRLSGGVKLGGEGPAKRGRAALNGTAEGGCPHLVRAVIIKVCSHAYAASDSIHHSS
jgi:hypothetical protein